MVSDPRRAGQALASSYTRVRHPRFSSSRLSRLLPYNAVISWFSEERSVPRLAREIGVDATHPPYVDFVRMLTGWLLSANGSNTGP